jgi:uncharacterized membrane protein YbhN (UPF0104 family)
MQRSHIIWLVKITVSAALLALIFHFVPFADVIAAARKLSPAMWLAALGLFLLGHAAAAAKWRLLIGPGVSFAAAFRAHLAGLAANLALPGVAGGDVVRAGLVIGQARDKARLAIGSIADRLLDTLGLLLIALTGAYFAWQPGIAGGYAVRTMLVLGVVGVVGGFAIAVPLDKLLKQRAPGGKLARMLSRMVGIIADLARTPGLLVACLGISMAVQCLFIGINIAFAHAAQVGAPVAAWFYGWASSKIIAIAPVSLGGLGVREASMAALMRPFGADPAQVVAIGLVWQTVLYASGLLGFLVQIGWRRPLPQAPVTIVER